MAEPQPPETVDAYGPLLLRPQAPAVRRLYRTAFLVVVAGLCVVFLLLFAWRLQSAQSQRMQPPELPGPRAEELASARPPIQELVKMPTSYEGINRLPPVPPLPEAPPTLPTPVPPQHHMAAAPPPAPPPGPAHAPSGPAAPASSPAEKTTKAPGKPWLFADVAKATPPFTPPASATTTAGATPSTRDERASLFIPATWERPEDPTKVLYRSQVILGQLLQEMNSDVPGTTRILITRPITDRFQQGHVLIPQFSVLLVRQKDRPRQGDTRLPIVLEEVHTPDGTVIHLAGQLGDKSGANGVPGKVNNHYVRLGVAAVLTAVLNVGTRAALGGNPSGMGQYNPSLMQEVGQDLGQSVGRTGQRLVQQWSEIPPTITVAAGSPVSIQLEENVSFQQPVKPFTR